MKHPTGEELAAYREGEISHSEAVAVHLAGCAECRTELERIESVLAALDTLPVPDPGEEYGRRVWQQIAPRLPRRRAWDWSAWLQPKRLLAASALAAVILAAFLAGRFWPPKEPDKGPERPEPTAEQVRERILLVAVGSHLDRSEMILVELSNAAPDARTPKQLNISAEQRRAEDLLADNRLYRQTAQHEGDAALASVLDDLERVLLDITHSPQEVTPAQFETIRKRIESRGILFKVRVVGKDVRQRQEKIAPAPAKDQSKKKERNKA
jgi:hypothetical protein